MEDLHKAIVHMVHERDWVTFAELSRLDGFTEQGGASLVMTPGIKRRKESVLWHNMTQEACDLILLLLNEHELTIAPASLLSYLTDGGFYTDKAWTPVCFRPPHEANQVGANGWFVYDPRRKTPSPSCRALFRQLEI